MGLLIGKIRIHQMVFEQIRVYIFRENCMQIISQSTSKQKVSLIILITNVY